MQVQRINVSVVQGKEVEEDVDLDQILSETDRPLAAVPVVEEKPEEQAEESIKTEICSEPDC